MGAVEGSSHPDTEISHGICGSCADNFTFQQGVPFQRYLDSIPVPVLAVDRFVVVKAVNRKACDMLGKEPREIIQHLGGNVFECAHARLPEGCGRTIHCSGCVIRKSVTRTFETGEPQMSVPATLRRTDPDHPSAVVLFITTVRSGDVVMLRVDRIE
jgi:PAS domain-containing protein